MNTRLEIHDDVAHVIFDREGSSANIFDRDTVMELAQHVEQLESLAAASKIRGAAFLSAKDKIFIAGADINAFLGDGITEADLEQMVAGGQELFTRIAKLEIPTVAAIHGACMGGGLEMCLACDWRIASDDSATRIGLPETNLGILPGWGGCTRLPRLIGLPKSLALILQGKRLAARQALKFGVVDDLVPREHFERWVRVKLGQGKRPRKWHLLTNNRLTAGLIRMRIRPQLEKKTRGHYPAVVRALEVTTKGVSLSVQRTLELERKALVELIQTDVSNNLVRVFLMQERAKHLRMKDLSIVPGAANVTSSGEPLQDIAVIGAGTMGAGIAQWCSARGNNVILKDVGLEQLAKGMQSIGKVYSTAARRRIFTRAQAQQGMDRVHPTTQDVPFTDTDLVIEAATENMEVKKKIFAGLERLAGDGTVLATNTSALSISELAASTQRPDRVIGVHFFNPVHRMQLVEIVVGKETAPEVTAKTLRFVQRIGKMPVVTRDSPGFVVNRILMPYLAEAGQLFAEGHDITAIDEAMLDFGMPMGPLRLIDEVGIDVAEHVASFFASTFGDRMPSPAALGEMAAKGLLGRKSNKGFYVYNGKKKGDPKPNLDIASSGSSTTSNAISRESLQQRMVLVMLNEAARCMEEDVVSAPEDVDFAMIMGTGFAPFRGGPLRYTDALGVDKVVADLERLADKHGARFAPCELLASMAKNNQAHYSKDRTQS